jgi:hypothetical protein
VIGGVRVKGTTAGPSRACGSVIPRRGMPVRLTHQAGGPAGALTQGLPVDLASTSQVGVTTQPGSAFVDTNELRNRQFLGPEGLLQLLGAGAGREPEFLGHVIRPDSGAAHSRRPPPATA